MASNLNPEAPLYIPISHAQQRVINNPVQQQYYLPTSPPNFIPNTHYLISYTNPNCPFHYYTNTTPFGPQTQSVVTRVVNKSSGGGRRRRGRRNQEAFDGRRQNAEEHVTFNWRRRSSDGFGSNNDNNNNNRRFDENQKKGFERKNRRSCFSTGCGGGSKQKHPVKEVKSDNQFTTVMIRNIPNRYTEMLLEFLDNHCLKENREANLSDNAADATSEEIVVSAFDFLYLPIDFGSNANKGYAFVNFTNPIALWRFYLAAHGFKWQHFHSNKICEIAIARIQGKEELIKHFAKSNLESDNEEYLPVCFSPPRHGLRKNVRQEIIGRLVKKQNLNKHR